MCRLRFVASGRVHQAVNDAELLQNDLGGLARLSRFSTSARTATAWFALVP